VASVGSYGQGAGRIGPTSDHPWTPLTQWAQRASEGQEAAGADQDVSLWPRDRVDMDMVWPWVAQ
jgi:hypothetical protein